MTKRNTKNKIKMGNLQNLIRSKPFLIMGILNITKDSFYDGNKFFTLDKAVERAFQIKEEGADIIDIGAESTRPFSEGISLDEEKDRIEKVLSALKQTSFDLPISVDTQKSEVAKIAVELGAEMINDVSAGRSDPKLLDIVSENKKYIVLMHMKGTPKNMQVDPRYDDVVREVKSEILSFAENAVKKGIEKEKIIIDPGIGFGKRTEDNIELISNLGQFARLNYKILIGVSRKSVIGKITGAVVEERLPGTIALNVCALFKGAKIFRVHDVKEHKQALSCAFEVIKKR